jgi:predicted RNA-binding Zn-ribbon protein involved in translation (DUF1610 family)
MKLLQLKCPSCGAKLTVSDHLKSYTCNFCGITTLLDDEVVKVEHYINNIEKDELFKKVDAYIKLGEFVAAKKSCEEMLEKYFYDPKAWLYAIAIATENYNENIIVDCELLNVYLNNYEKLEQKEDEKVLNIKKVEKYILEYNKKIEKETLEYNKKISNFSSVDLECPYCGESIKFGQEQCYNCEEDLFWPDI